MAEGRIEIEPVLESVLRYCLKDARERMEAGRAIAPFSALAVKDKLFMEEHAADTPAESHAAVRKTVAGTRGAQAYGFCYDGYVEVSAGEAGEGGEGGEGSATEQRDCLIAEGGTPGAPHGHAIGLLYRVGEDGTFTFEDEPIYVGKTLNYMANLEPEPASDAESEGTTDPAI